MSCRQFFILTTYVFFLKTLNGQSFVDNGFGLFQKKLNEIILPDRLTELYSSLQSKNKENIFEYRY